MSLIKMNPYRGIEDLYEESLGISLFNLREPGLCAEALSGCHFKPPKQGVYLLGALEPIAPFETPEQFYLEKTSPTAYRKIQTPTEFIQAKGEVYTAEGQFLLTSPQRGRQSLKLEAPVNPNMIYFGLLLAWEHLRRNTASFGSALNFVNHSRDYRHYLAEFSDPLPEDAEDIFEHPLARTVGYRGLLGNLENLFNAFPFNLYTLSLQGTSLAVNRGQDARIIEYYRGIFEKEEQKRFLERGY